MILTPIVLAALSFTAGIGCSDSTSVQQTAEETKPQIEFTNLTVTVLGDSISAGVGSRGVSLHSFPENSWATGTELPGEGSHFQRLEKLGAANNFLVQPINLAQAGAQIVTTVSPLNLNSQALELDTYLNEEDFNYVAMFMGANDVCWTNSTPEILRQNMKAQVASSLAAFGAKADLILIPSLPDIDRVVNTPTLCPMPFPAVIQSAVREYMCPNAKKSNFNEYVEAANQALQEAASESPYNVIFDGKAVNTSSLTSSLMSQDCFHPSISGQLNLADTLWPEVEKAITGQ